ncbi:hypothetical protein BABINDRAFT_162362 [Babjeviella inositovora NRRL Y-12698]|uniref:Copper acquisition factor BIM1-like domain-containing protein n=1 Tax=Babjeviella inositovora NRRL Y-12698 TaxID=984486 RepID=A0A1E3QLT3_9ASCO|nr:uncharacterized protein BABINDRAFT_162362 [Babjeviella inositovora NRRL Y-12698]ODQ78656.1 hypothetical protein BABINDRAFT_162362 [Babjeviella inositovora NRRL Y-12698]
MQLTSLLAVAVTLVSSISARAAPFASPLKHGSEFVQTNGEVGMLYPATREWTESAELTAPCGSNAKIQDRTIFPLDDGFVSLIASERAFEVSLRISYNKNPTKNSDFDTWYTGNVSKQMDIGHTCFQMPDQPSNINSGDVATIQLEYMYEEDGKYLTHYACADIEFVEESVFKLSDNALSCFNATSNDYYSEDLADRATTTAKTSSTSSAKTSSTSSAGAGHLETATGSIVLGGLFYLLTAFA